MNINNNKDGTWTYLTIHCKLPGNALNLIPANFSRKPFDPGGKVGFEHKRKLKQIFIKIYVHTKVSHPQQRDSVWRHWRKMYSHIGGQNEEMGSAGEKEEVEHDRVGWGSQRQLSPIFPPKQTRNHNLTAKTLSTLNTFCKPT